MTEGATAAAEDMSGRRRATSGALNIASKSRACRNQQAGRILRIICAKLAMLSSQMWTEEEEA
jgi:hypothetical protein